MSVTSPVMNSSRLHLLFGEDLRKSQICYRYEYVTLPILQVPTLPSQFGEFAGRPQPDVSVNTVETEMVSFLTFCFSLLYPLLFRGVACPVYKTGYHSQRCGTQ